MLVGRLRDGMLVGTGISVMGKPVRDGAYCKITLSNGTEIRVHKTTHVAELFIGHVPAESLMSSTVHRLTDVRASSPEWRGENVGKRGERLIANRVSWDARALSESHSRQLSER